MADQSVEILPIPGDPSAVRIAASKYTLTADALRDAAAELRRLITLNEAGCSEAVDALVGVSTDVAARLDRLHGRYETAGSALTIYSTDLETAQGQANTAIGLGDTARTEAANAEYWVDYHETDARAATDPAVQAEAERLALRYRENLELAGVDLTSAQTLYRQALELRDGAADTAERLISQSIENDGINDSGWDNFSSWVADHAELLQIIKTALSVVAGALALASLFIPVLAPFALVAAGLTAILSLVLASTGQISWIEFGLDFLAVATLGVAAVAGAALKGTMAALKTTRVSQVAASSAGKNPLRVVTGSFNGVQAPKKTLVNKLFWGKEVYEASGVQNAQSMRILANSKAGAGGSIDDGLIAQGRLQIAVQKGALAASETATLGDLGMTWAGPLADQIAQANIPGADDVLSGISDVSEWYAGVNETSTWRVGSSW